MKNYLLISAMLLLFSQVVQAQDSLILVNDDVIIGEVKELKRGVVTIETDYSDSDFKIEWDGVKEIYTTSYYLITLWDGTRLNGTVNSEGESYRIDADSGVRTVSREEIVDMNSIDASFISRLSASIELGYSFTKANNLQQFSFLGAMGYTAKRMSGGFSFNAIRSTQDEVDDIQRTNIDLYYRYFLQKDWFIPVDVGFLSNTEQSIDLRTVIRVGIGKYLIHTNYSNWSVNAGLSYNNEKFDDSLSTKRSSMEVYFGTELDLFDIGDLSLKTNVFAYPSVTESSRWRVDSSTNLKYDILGSDFYIKASFTINYDNEPVDSGDLQNPTSTTDYVFQTTFGWEL